MGKSKNKDLETELWGISNMLLYTEKKFGLHGVLKESKESLELFNSSLNSTYVKYLQKMMKDYHLCGTKDNGDNDYTLPQFLAKPFIDYVGGRFLATRLTSDEKNRIKKVIEEKNDLQNQALNQQQQKIYYEEILPIYESEQKGYYEPDPKPVSHKYDIIRDYGGYTPENEALFVERTMIRALCSAMFDFDEDTLRKDFQDFFFECIDQVTDEIQGDYTVLKHRLEHPEDYYYRLKGKKLKDTLLKELKAIDK
mgnify:CR=1 FL=1